MYGEKRRAYLKEYYKNNKIKYAISKRYQYWRKKAREICNDEETIMSMSLNALQSLCREPNIK